MLEDDKPSKALYIMPLKCRKTKIISGVASGRMQYF